MKNNAQKSLETKEHQGFTLIEVMVSIALISMVAVYFVQYQLDSVNQRMAEAVAQDMLSIANTATSYYSEAMEWPDEAGDCVGLLTTLGNNDAFPDNHTPPLDVSYQFACPDNGQYGRILTIAATFPAGGNDNADLLLSYLPTSSKEVDNGIATVTHFVSQPRKATRRYGFQKPTITSSNGTFILSKPTCWGDQTQSYMLIPQAVCVTGARHGIGGFYFTETSSNADSWSMQLMVAPGAEGGLGSFRSYNNDCGSNITVGAIVYCE